MLTCLRRLPELHASVKSGRWADAWRLQDHFGELCGRTVGLLGYGEVPKVLHPILEALGAKVLYWSRSRRNAERNELMSASDVVSLHLPLTPETSQSVDPRRMKRGAILVNTARGALVNEDFLYEALKSGRLAAAGLDVFAQEPPRADHPVLSLSNVVCAPHLAWLTGETLQRSIAAARHNVERLKNGIALLNRVA